MSRVLIVTVHDVPAGQTPKQFATALFNKWGIGSKQRGNGVFKNAKRVEIEVGEGIEQRFDNSWCTSMLKAEVIPSFKQGKFGAGVLHGVEQIGERLRGGSEFYGSKSESVAEDLPLGRRGHSAARWRVFRLRWLRLRRWLFVWRGRGRGVLVTRVVPMCFCFCTAASRDGLWASCGKGETPYKGEHGNRTRSRRGS